MRYFAAVDGQYIFNLQLRWIGSAFNFLFHCLVFSPLIMTGYWITSLFLDRHASGLWWVLSITAQSFLLYAVVYFLKGILAGLKTAGRRVWVVMWLLLTAYTCILPVWLAFQPVARYLHNNTLALLLSIALGVYVYSRYLLHADTAPKLVKNIYRSGFHIAAFFKQ